MATNKTALVTGSTRGIGKSIAKLLCEQGYNVYISARTKEDLEKTSKEIPVKGWYCADLESADDCKNLIEKVVADAGSIDILVNNAGAYIYSPVEKTNYSDIEKLINLNIRALYLLTQYSVFHMKKSKWGRIVNIGSISGSVGEANASLYSMTKSALSGFSKSLALELASDNITVNTINPGWVDTDLADKAVSDSNFSYEEEIDMIPQRRFIEPVEIAHLVAYMVSEEAKGMTGQSVNLCAGLSVG